MCGICGIINFNSQAVEEVTIRQMMLTMKHRGPDDEGVFMEDAIGLGFVRLSIIDLSSDGNQPKFSADGRYVIVFNGEIFNYIELREELEKIGVKFVTKTDTEVLLNAYIQWGEDCMHKFNGMWAFVIYDRDLKTIFASRDRYGIKPFYYIQTEKYFAFCSEIKPLLYLLPQKPTPNYQSIFDLLVFNRTDQTTDTFFLEIKKLKHGNSLTIRDNQLKFNEWYNLREKVLNLKGFQNADDFKKLLSSAIELRLRCDVPVGVCLSGGLDSSTIVSLLLQDYNLFDLHTFSAIYDNGQIGDEKLFIMEYDQFLKNMYFINPNANTLKNDLNEFVIAQAEPMATTSPYAQFKVMELAKNKIVVSLDGQGADELLGGYHDFFSYYFKELLINFHWLKLINEIFHYFRIHRSIFALKAFMFLLLPENLKTFLRIKEFNFLLPEFSNKFSKSNNVSKNLYGAKSLQEALLRHFEYKLEHLLKWEDLNSMHFSIEARVPFLDYRLVEKTLATKSDLIIRKGITKFILREGMKNVLPENIRTRKDKLGFATPQDEWFREAIWKEFIRNILSSEKFKSRNIINSDRAIKLFELHLSGKENHSKEIWKWIHLELWFREFID